MDVTVVGGGLAGLVAAITAAEAGAQVRLYEAHSQLGGRARTTDGAYLANDGTRVFYSDGPHWAWLNQRGLAEPAAALGARELTRGVFRHDGRMRRTPPAGLLRAARHRRLRAPVDRDFHSWSVEHLGLAATRAVEGFAGILTYDANPGRLSAEFVWTRFLRVARPAPRYVIGGWQAVVDRLAAHAEQLGVHLETGSRITTVPVTPLVVATQLASARQLLGDETLVGTSGNSALLDVGLVADQRDPFLAWDLDEGGFVERYSSPDPSLAPAGHSLVQAQLPLRAGETRAQARERLEQLFDQTFTGWRERVAWRRGAVATGRTGALDLPGRTWRDRPAIDRGHGIYLAGDEVAAPGLLSEVAFNSALEAGRRAAAGRRSARPADDAEAAEHV
ncbi:MAG: NAD(P)-binding protein [Streptosporangiales bacterium]|nr:NAD(P)-binding protein [Streptosporangiales bacterium]